MINVSHLQKFLLGGKAEVTLVNQITKNEYSYFIKRKLDDNGEQTDVFYIYLVGKRKGDYLGFFRVRDNSPEPVIVPSQLTISKKIDEDNRKAFTIIDGFISILYRQNLSPRGVKVFYNGRCSVCNRVLKDPVYIEIGIGPECLKKM
jgi:hypothetical protein